MRSLNTRLAAAAVATLVIIVGGSVAQEMVGSGHALDGSLMVGSGGYNYGKLAPRRSQTSFAVPLYSPSAGRAGLNTRYGFGTQSLYRPAVSTSMGGRRTAYGRAAYGGKYGGKYGGRYGAPRR